MKSQVLELAPLIENSPSRPIGFALVWRSCYNAAELEVDYLDN